MLVESLRSADPQKLGWGRVDGAEDGASGRGSGNGRISGVLLGPGGTREAWCGLTARSSGWSRVLGDVQEDGGEGPAVFGRGMPCRDEGEGADPRTQFKKGFCGVECVTARLQLPGRAALEGGAGAVRGQLVGASSWKGRAWPSPTGGAHSANERLGGNGSGGEGRGCSSRRKPGEG